ncbi:hypothetical protein GGF39_002571 [Coemansia sp. RSA 1721]|nr:hypothetical protein GGF39_002571 [Coemansia sp. RSA 1721]
MTVNEKKRTAEQLLELSMTAHREAAAKGQRPRETHSHPCFWSVLHGESLNFVYISASLHSFLGADRAAAMTNQSLFDFIHPEEATRARRDLVDTFISKSLFGSGIRCRLRRFDLERPGGFQHLFRRASESHILRQSHHHAQHVHEAFERKMSLPIIPDMAKLRSMGHSSHHNVPLLPHSPSNHMHQPMPKRLRTILEDSIGSFAAEQQRGDDKINAANNGIRASGIKTENTSVGDQSCGGGGGGGGEEQPRGYKDVARCCISHIDSVATSIADPNNDLGDGGCDNGEYLIANIGLYLVSSRLSIMVCHYEDSPKSRGLLPLCSADNLPTGPQPNQCDCASSALAMAMADAERAQFLLSQIHKLDTIGTFNSPAIHPPLLPATSRSASSTNSSGKGPAAAGAAANISSRHVQIYSIESQRLLCAFPEEGYRKTYSKTAADAAAQGASLQGLWKSCSDKKAASQAQALLENLGVPNPDPFHLELQIQTSDSAACVDVQCILFRWGRLLFVCQQVRSDVSPDSGIIAPSRPGVVSARLAASANSAVPAPASSAPITELRQRAMAGANMRASGPLNATKGMGELSSTQPTPTISPLTASIVQHTPVSLSPAPQTQPHSASSVASGSFQVNVYPPPDTPESWRWSQGSAHAAAQQQQQHHHHQYQHQMLMQKHGAQSFSAVSSQKPPPPLPISRGINHPLHYGVMHGSIQDHYQSPIGSAVASPSIVGTPSSAPAAQQRMISDPDKKTCKSCGTDSSPEWRKGPTGHKT